MLKTIEELDDYIPQFIQKCFWANDMRILKEEIEKLKPGDIYVEIGVDEGGSARVAHEYGHPDVYKLYIDINNVDPHSKSIGRGRWMQQEGMVGIGKKGFFIHGDADQIAKIWNQKIDLLFIDGHHDYDSVKANTLAWEPFMRPATTILFHDYDHPETKRWLDEHYGKNIEVLHDKMVRIRK